MNYKKIRQALRHLHEQEMVLINLDLVIFVDSDDGIESGIYEDMIIRIDS